ncbi:MAG: alpha/beta hydrolase [Candidatus Omnitrophica bacterium]|nr:alpha/beta hydrolase [Candidatus Omnitrophota bacterium]
MLASVERKKIVSVSCCNQVLPIVYSDCGEGFPLLYLHGWGQNLGAFGPLIDALPLSLRHIAVDFPGFGDSPKPAENWGVPDYAEFVHQFIKKLDLEPCIIIGHSFGGRVGFRLAHKRPECVLGLFLIGAAGIRRKVPLRRRIRIKTIRGIARAAARCIPNPIGAKIKGSLYNRIASRDYKEAGAMRGILVKVIHDDVRDILSSIQQPVTLLYGSDDSETPPETGRQMHDRLPNSDYIELPGFDHYTILTRGRHQIAHQLKNFLQKWNATS